MLKVQFNAGESRAALQRAKLVLEDMTPVYSDIGEYMIEATRRRFVEGKAPDGTRWAPKKQATLDRYKRMGYGTLRRPLIGPSKLLSRLVQKFVSRNGVVIGSSQIYAGVMQDGARKGAFGTDSRGRSIPWGDIPARTWLGISQLDGQAIVEIAEEHIARAIPTD